MRIQQSLTDYINSQFAAGCHFRLQSFSSRRPRSFYISQHGQSAPRIALTLVLTKGAWPPGTRMDDNTKSIDVLTLGFSQYFTIFTFPIRPFICIWVINLTWTQDFPKVRPSSHHKNFSHQCHSACSATRGVKAGDIGPFILSRVISFHRSQNCVGFRNPCKKLE